MEYCRFKANTFRAGQIVNNIDQWKVLTSDREILDTVEGQNIELIDIPIQVKPPYQPQWSIEQAKLIDSEIIVLKKKGIIEPTVREHNDFISTIFLRPKRDGTYRMILNLKSLNHYVKYHHFKMDTIATAIEMVTPGCFMASIDLKYAYYSVAVAIANEDRKNKFSWRDNLLLGPRRGRKPYQLPRNKSSSTWLTVLPDKNCGTTLEYSDRQYTAVACINQMGTCYYISINNLVIEI